MIKKLRNFIINKIKLYLRNKIKFYNHTHENIFISHDSCIYVVNPFIQRGKISSYIFDVRACMKPERSAGRKSYGRKKSDHDNYCRQFWAQRMPPLAVFNGSSVSGEVTNNIDLPVNGIISQPVRRHVYHGARARFRVDGTNASTTERTESHSPPPTCPFTPVLHFRHFPHTPSCTVLRGCLPFAKIYDDPAVKGQCLARQLKAHTSRGKTLSYKHVVNFEMAIHMHVAELLKRRQKQN